MNDIISRYARVAQELGWKLNEKSDIDDARLEYTASNGTPYYTALEDYRDIPYGEQVLGICNEFEMDEYAVELYEQGGYSLNALISDYAEVERNLYPLYVAWSVLDEAIAKEQKQTQAAQEFTDREKQLISGAIITQLGEISKAIETCARTANNELLAALKEHANELQRLNCKVCNYLDECK